ncbi:uncharacterized protein L3040_003631 [Drepanopeziza brunnea f. sp. 'multigermtubi']|uniref:Uncharacterized protein n=1 Tax=Marssonina brunnea f. sp. multigermtubi (strain MB_m1) TaxID=1072389 RepID=K1WAF2_MARBU|nr:uncharacterized protein MBM_07460 [Drepanopeziza brunnea f. sp. 'multigermtubi' MB_m1]EKD14230.1 hypothetical protein MBM_07460 [Drepanopeziza brunnea f. sp. 'multigermtubi' MB_m1]KAJ5046387.1 hypothetical protein L3040_003631 [Drepanopeziza brunnea f. sp. 'multigermtubi']
MGNRIVELIQSKFELFRLEKRYTRTRNRRSTFVSEAQYVDGEYIYSPTSAYSTKHNTGSSRASDSTTDTNATQDPKVNRRISKVALDKIDWRKGGRG